MARRWSEDEDALLLKMRNEGFSTREIAQRLRDRTHGAIRARLSTISTTNLNRLWSEDDIKTLFTLREEGFSLKYIAKLLGRTYTAVSTFYAKHSTSYYTSAKKDC